MRRPFLRPVGALLLIPLSVQLAACVVHTAPRPVPREEVQNPAGEEIYGVTTVGGEVVMFEMPKVNPARRDQGPGMAPYVRGDTLYAKARGEAYRIPTDQVQRYWIREVSTGKTIGLTAAIVGGAILAAVLIAAASEPEPTTTQSCPFIYSWNGSEWVFDGEPYGGATTRGLERDDYAELEHLVAEDGEYRLRVTNEVPETQYTNHMELIVVDHAPGTRVVSDGRGGFHALRAPVPPVRAEDETGHDLTAWLSEEDHRIWEPAPEPTASGDRSEIVLTFPRPPDAGRATLVYRAGTGLWGSWMIKSMLLLHGDEVDEWYSTVDSDPAARSALHEWNLREELYTLKVQVERSGRWEDAGEILGGGPIVLESRTLPLDLAGADAGELRIRIRPPRGFWALDAFAIEYGEPAAPARVTPLPPVRATDQLGRDVAAALAAADEDYYAMPSNDDRAEVVFRAPPAVPGMERTVFLHARGWYRIHLPGTGAPDRETLLSIATVPGAAARYAAESFDRWQLALR